MLAQKYARGGSADGGDMPGRRREWQARQKNHYGYCAKDTRTSYQGIVIQYGEYCKDQLLSLIKLLIGQSRHFAPSHFATLFYWP